MIEGKSRVSLLTSKAASYISNDKIWNKNEISSAYWTQYDQYTLQYSTFRISPKENGYNNTITACGLSVSVTGGAELEYYVQVVYSPYVKMESSWKSVNELQYLTWDWDNHTRSDYCYIYYYVRRVDGEPLSRSSLYPSSVFAYGFNDVPFDIEVTQTTAIPSDWLDNTTQTYQTATTATRPAAYDDLVGTVPALTPDVGGTPPSWFEQYNPMEQPWFVDIIASLADFTDIVTSVADQMKIFWVFGGFVITGLLLAWLLH